MNKTIIIAGGASLASLAAGGVAGYFYAKNKLGAEFDLRLEHELEEAKKKYSVMLSQASKPSPESLAKKHQRGEPTEEEASDEPSDEEIFEQEAETKEREKNGKAALTNYQNFHKAPADDGLVHQNIFSGDGKHQRPLPPRDNETGRFVSQRESSDEEDKTGIEVISAEMFVANPMDNHQDALLWFINDDTLLKKEDTDETVDVMWVGPENLTIDKFPPQRGMEPQCIYVRNHSLGIDYDITLRTDSLTDFMGFGENAGESDDARYL